MEQFSKNLDLRWADLDPNFHVRHSVFYDYGASVRIEYLEKNGLTTAFMQQKAFGPVIFREECLFKRELRIPDVVTIDIRLRKCSAEFHKWTIQHNIYKNKDTLAAVITVDGAWIDTVKRKLTIPPAEVRETFGNMPRHENFEWIN